MSRPSRKKIGNRRCWGFDPIKTRSNWIVSVYNSRGTKDIYHVPANILEELSPNRVPYFEKIFNDEMVQTGENRSEITILDDAAAEGFGTLLDFLYCETKKDEQDFLFNVKNGLKLYKIAEHFDVKPLQDMLCKFYRETTLAFNAVDFINEARKLDSNEMLETALDQFARKMHAAEYVEEKNLEPNFLLQALKRRKALKIPSSQWDSEIISCFVALCTKHHKGALTRSLFYKLTHVDYIPNIDQEAALQLLTVESESGFWDDNDSFSSVQGRCIRSLLADWNGLREKFDSDAAFWKSLKRLSPSILGILLMHSTGTAHGFEEQAARKGGSTGVADEALELKTVLSN